MKVSPILLASVVHGAPDRERRGSKAEPDVIWSTPPVPCSEPSSSNGGGSPFTEVDNGASGQVTFESYQNYANCYVDIGTNCGPDGVQVKIVDMQLELNYTYYDYGGCVDTINFAWLNQNGVQEQTEPQCGCVGVCNQSLFPQLDQLYDTQQPSNYNLVGTNAKIVLKSDSLYHGGNIQVNWKCNSQPTMPASAPTDQSTSSNQAAITNTIEMADAIFSQYKCYRQSRPCQAGDFRDYGCAGRGLFDPFGRTLGTYQDEVDIAFLNWKKCVQCASGGKKANVLAYSYDANSDTCGKY